MSAAVYLLRDAATSEVRYVGMTYVRTPEDRWRGHLIQTPPIREWVRSGGAPAWEVVARFCGDDERSRALKRESALVKAYRGEGHRLFNGWTSPPKAREDPVGSRRIAAWVNATGIDKASGLTGVSVTTLSRYATGQTSPRGANLKAIARAVASHERKASKPA